MPTAPDNHDAHDYAERLRSPLPQRLQFLLAHEAILVHVEPVKERGREFFAGEFAVVVLVVFLKRSLIPAVPGFIWLPQRFSVRFPRAG
jgi:hypothetical protein